MPDFVLDSDAVSLFVHHEKQQPRLVQRILGTPPESLWISIITLEEAWQGAINLVHNPRMPGIEMRACEFLRRVLQNYARFQILPYDGQARKVFDGMTAAEKRVGRNDCKLAAIAMSRGYTVVTCNVKDFQQIRGVTFEDWTKEPYIAR